VRLPLLGCVVTNERLIERTANQRNSLLLEVLRFVDVLLRSLFLDEFPSLIWGVVTAKELVNQPQPHWELVRRAIMHGKYSVLIVGEIRELSDIVPHALVRGVEKVCAVLVNLDAGFWFRLRVRDRKSTRLNSSHVSISYAAFRLKR